MSAIIMGYAVLVREGRIALSGVPSRYREAVGAELAREEAALEE